MTPTEARLAALVDEADRIAEIPDTIRGTTPVTVLGRILVPCPMEER